MLMLKTLLNILIAVILLTLQSQAKAVSVIPYTPDEHTLLLCHFDQEAQADFSCGNQQASGFGRLVSAGKFGGGFQPEDGGVKYFAHKNINLEKGTIEFWIKPAWSGDDGQVRIFLDVNCVLPQNLIQINKLGKIKSKFNGKLAVAVASRKKGEKAVWAITQVPGKNDRHDISDWQPGQWHHIAFEWESGLGELFVDGEKVSSTSKIAIPQGQAREIIVGSKNCAAIIDELRISKIRRSAINQATQSLKISKGVYLSDLKPITSRQTITPLGIDCFETFTRKIPLTLKAKQYKKGLGMHANSCLVFDIGQQYEVFRAVAGISDYAGSDASVVLKIYGDQKLLFESPTLRRTGPQQEISIPVTGIKNLTIIAEAGETYDSDHFVLCDAILFKKGASVPQKSETIQTKSGTLENDYKAKTKDENTKVWIDEIAEYVDISAEDNNAVEKSLYSYKFKFPKSNKGYLISITNYLDEITADRIAGNYKNQRLECFATPGEYEPMSFVIYANKTMNDIKVTVGDLSSGDSILPGKNFDIRYGMRVLQRLRYSYPASKSIVTTRFMRKFDTLTIPSGMFRQIFVTVKVPLELKAGIYKGNIRISSENSEEFFIPLQVSVLPFRLEQDSRKRYGMYYFFNKRLLSPKQMNLELDDIRQHGVDLIFTSNGVAYKFDSNGKILIDTRQIEKTMEILDKKGFKSAVVDTGFYFLARMVCPAKYRTYPQMAEYIQQSKTFKSKVLEVMDFLKKLQSRYPNIEIVLTHMDEVFNKNRLPLYIAITKIAKQTDGFKYYITFHTKEAKFDKMRKQLDPYVDMRGHHMYTWEWFLARGTTLTQYRKELDKSDDIAGAYYNPVGVHYSPEWYRIIMGIQFWVAPFSFHMPFAYAAYAQDPLNDLDANWGDHLFGVTYNNELVMAKIWEGYRQGRDDLRYLYTLEKMLNQTDNPKSKTVVKARRWLNGLKKKIPKPTGLDHDNNKLLGTKKECPWTHAISEKFSFEDYQNIRKKAARIILMLSGENPGKYIQ